MLAKVAQIDRATTKLLTSLMIYILIWKPSRLLLSTTKLILHEFDPIVKEKFTLLTKILGYYENERFFWVVWVMVGSWFFGEMTQRKNQDAGGLTWALGHLGHGC